MSDSKWYDDDIDASEEQLDILCELGVSGADLEGLSYDEAEEMIAELAAMREDSGRFTDRFRS